MAGTIVNIPVVQFFDNNGNPLAGGKITTYLSNTTTPESTWQDEALSTLNTNPIILDARGEATIWLTPEVQYTFVVTDADDNLIETINDIYGSFQTIDTSTLSGFRNKLIGGNFSTNPWQRGTTITAPTNGQYTADRFRVNYSTTAVVNVLKTADAPTAAQAGVYTQHCLHVDVTTADASLAAGDNFVVRQLIEGLNAASFGFGQAGTRYVTLSFWHKHTKTGVHCVSFSNSASNRSYVAEYTQDVSDTWEEATITIPVDTTGTWLYDTGIGLVIDWCLAAGTTFQGTANTWTAGLILATSSQVNNLDSTSNNFKIVLTQLEIGDIKTGFETQDVGTVLQQCQRYYEKSYNLDIVPGSVSSSGEVNITGSSDASGQIVVPVRFATAKRANPTMVFYTSAGTSGSWSYTRSGVGATNITVTGTNIGQQAFLAVTNSIGANYVSAQATGQWVAVSEL